MATGHYPARTVTFAYSKLPSSAAGCGAMNAPEAEAEASASGAADADTDAALALAAAAAAAQASSLTIKDNVLTLDTNTATSAHSYPLPKWIILHYSPFKAVWDQLIMLMCIYTAIFTPFTTTFLIQEEEHSMQTNLNAKTRTVSASNQIDPLAIADLVVDLTFIADIIISFRTTYVYNGEVITNPQTIAKYYLKRWFILDAIAALPLDILVFGNGGPYDTLFMAGILKTPRLFRLFRVTRGGANFEYGGAVLLGLMGAFAIVAHWLACVFYAIAYVERQTLAKKISWLDALANQLRTPYNDNRTGGPDLLSRYITSLYFTFTTLTSIGFGNVFPNTDYEKIFAVIAMLAGSLLNAAIFGNVSSIMLRLMAASEELHEKQESVYEFIKFHHIPKTLAHRLLESLHNTWSYTKGLDMNGVLKSFPDVLQADICLHLNRKLLSSSAAFEGASPGCLRAFSMKFKTVHVPPGDNLIHQGDLLDAVFFVARGTVEATANGECIVILGKADIFGDCVKDAVGRVNAAQSSHTVRALTYCDLNKIQVADLKVILSQYPEFADNFFRNFDVTFNMHTGQLRRTNLPTDEEVIKFIKQKRPALQYRCHDRRKTFDTNQSAVLSSSIMSPSSTSMTHFISGSPRMSSEFVLAPSFTLLPPPAEFSDCFSPTHETSKTVPPVDRRKSEVGTIDEREYLEQIKQLQVLDSTLDTLHRRMKLFEDQMSVMLNATYQALQERHCLRTKSKHA